MQYLKANDAATVMIGPFVDKGDGVTPEEGITLANVDSAELMKHDGTTFVDLTSDSRTWTHREKGMYTLVLGTGDTDTEGRLTVFFSDEAVCLPVWKDFMVLAEAAYDSMFAAKDTGYMDINVKAVGETATPHTSGKLHVLQGDGNAITAVGPTNTQLNTAITLVTDDLDNGTDGLGALKDLIDAAQGDITTVAGYTDKIDDATNGLTAIKAEVEGLGGAAMVGTNSAATEAKQDIIDTNLDKVITAMELDGAVYRFTENALEEGPSGTGGDATATNQETLIQILTGKWEIVNNQLIMYDTDGTTALYTFDLTRDGVASEFNPDKREAA